MEIKKTKLTVPTEETQYIELKREFKWSKIQKEIAGMINANHSPDKNGEIWIGIEEDKEGVRIWQDAKELKPDKSFDLIEGFLEQYSIEWTCEREGNLYKISFPYTNKVIMIGGNIYNRYGTSVMILQEKDRATFLANKKQQLLQITNEDYNPGNFSSLDQYINEYELGITLNDLVEKTGIATQKGTLKRKNKETVLAKYFRDDCEKYIIFNDVKITGSMHKLYIEVQTLANDKMEKLFYIKNGPRKKIKDLTTDKCSISFREILINAISHHDIMSNEILEIVQNDQVFKFTNSLQNFDNMKRKLENNNISHNAVNQALFDSLRQMKIVEGLRTGFTNFKELQKDKVVILLKGNQIIIYYIIGELKHINPENELYKSFLREERKKIWEN